MSNYFTDSYLPRINRFGTNLQERIINKKEYDFHHFVEKSPNRVTVFIRDFQFEGVLQTKTYDEIETIDYFLTYKTIPIEDGSILKVRSIKDMNQYSYWIIVAKDNFVSAGYNRYTVVKLDREVRWITEEGLIYKALAHISGSGSGGTNRRLISSVKINDTVVYMPNQVLTMVMQDNDEIKRGIRIHIGKDMAWKISGIDKVTNEGVAYLTLEQDYFDKQRDDTTHLDPEPSYEEGLANGEKLSKWTFDSNVREEVDSEGKRWIEVRKDEQTAINFYSSYFNKVTNKDYVVEVKDTSVLKYNKKDRFFIGLEEGETEVIIRLIDSPDIFGIFYFRVLPSQAEINDFSVEGPARMKYGIPSRFKSKMPFEVEQISNMKVKDLGQIEENGQQFYVLEITYTEIVKNLALNFSAKDSDLTYTKYVDVESPWIGG